MEKICPCGKIIFVKPYLIHRKKYCSKVCHYKYHGRRKGLKYKLVKHNPTSFKRGHKPWNFGLDLGEKATNWKGNNVSYDALHDWVQAKLGKPKMCEICGTTTAKRYDWSNKSGQYKRDLSDWQRLCLKCHPRYDYEKFGARKCFYERNRNKKL